MLQINFFLTAFLNIILFISPALKHEYYISSTDVVYIQETSQIQITSRLFIDDVEAFLVNIDFTIKIRVIQPPPNFLPLKP